MTDHYDLAKRAGALLLATITVVPAAVLLALDVLIAGLGKTLSNFSVNCFAYSKGEAWGKGSESMARTRQSLSRKEDHAEISLHCQSCHSGPPITFRNVGEAGEAAAAHLGAQHHGDESVIVEIRDGKGQILGIASGSKPETLEAKLRKNKIDKIPPVGGIC